jgi:phage terminase small subunit
MAYSQKGVIYINTKLTPKQRAFVDRFVLLKNGTQAAIDAGYNVKSRIVAKEIATENLSKPAIKEAIAEKQQQYESMLLSEVVNLLRNLLDIAYDETIYPGVRVRAITDLLDRAGLGAKKELSLSGGDEPIVLESRITNEIAKRAREMLAQNMSTKKEESQA